MHIENPETKKFENYRIKEEKRRGKLKSKNDN